MFFKLIKLHVLVSELYIIQNGFPADFNHSYLFKSCVCVCVCVFVCALGAYNI